MIRRSTAPEPGGHGNEYPERTPGRAERPIQPIGTMAVSLLLVLSCTGLLRAQAEQNSRSDVLAQGKAAARRGDLATAENLFEQAVRAKHRIRQKPVSGSGLPTTWRLGHTNKAEAQLLKAVYLRHSSAEAYNNSDMLH